MPAFNSNLFNNGRQQQPQYPFDACGPNNDRRPVGALHDRVFPFNIVPPSGPILPQPPQYSGYPNAQLPGPSMEPLRPGFSIDATVAGPPSHQGGSPVYLQPAPGYSGSASRSVFDGNMQGHYNAALYGHDWLCGPTGYGSGLSPMSQYAVLPQAFEQPHVGDSVSSRRFEPSTYDQYEPPAPSNVFMTIEDGPCQSPSPTPNTSMSRSVPCQWGGNCQAVLDDLSAAGISRHLKEYHLPTWDPRARGKCEWHGSPCTNIEMYYNSFGKHIASVHLGATARPCEKCGETFARPDTLDRHMKLYCRLRSK